VTIQGKPVTVDAANQFAGPATLESGSNIVTIRAVDPSGNSAVANYQVNASGAGRTFTYDANGNLTSDGARAFEWDALNQLVAVNAGTHRSEFTYDGLQRRVRVVEKESGVTQSDSRIIWCKDEICEERAADGITVTKRLLIKGEQLAGVARLFVTDHLGSVTEVTDGSGTLVARYDFDLWGRRTTLVGTAETTVGFTGHEVHSSGGILLSQYRAYDPELGRWLSADPLRDVDGPNRYAYVNNRPLNMQDRLGLQATMQDQINCLKNWTACDDVDKCKDEAFSLQAAKFPNQGHNDTGDAFRHCYWSCCMTKALGAEEAKRWGDGHESGGGDCRERDQDYNNNYVGRRLAAWNPKGDCSSLCEPKYLMCELPKKCKNW
jgi:RHS repeat-associated protein